MKNKTLLLKKYLLILIGIALVVGSAAGYDSAKFGLGCLVWAEMVAFRIDSKNS